MSLRAVALRLMNFLNPSNVRRNGKYDKTKGGYNDMRIVDDKNSENNHFPEVGKDSFFIKTKLYEFKKSQ